MDKESLLQGNETTLMGLCCTHCKNKPKEIRYLRLLRLIDIPIRRHVKIRADANPLDSKWKSILMKE
ncbi:hypothetical protein [Wolbachia endosymbiont of Aedes aegypti]|uniref:hypothetical protein n=1 Tax=Wolbachia endosymbiont of Aedes aegypti TaxID=546165 RepID=UPI001FDA4F02|nr:hypothetical protein [Wolbachia endosymbiont of Aedes aegypti]